MLQPLHAPLPRQAVACSPCARRGRRVAGRPHLLFSNSSNCSEQPPQRSELQAAYSGASSNGAPQDGSSSGSESSGSASTSSGMLDGLTSADFCIIESRDAVKDFENYDQQEISNSIAARRTRIFLLMEEVRRLRIQQRLKGGDMTQAQELAEEKFVSALPFLPPLDETTLSQYYYAYAGLFAIIILFGGIISPVLELKLGVGGTSYVDFVESVHLPSQLAQVDPIVASFCGGAVGVLSALLLVEVNNIKKQQKNRCHYCKGTGYLMCGNCIGSGIDPASRTGCVDCARSGKVMCTGCLCTGKSLATEHDPRIDPFD